MYLDFLLGVSPKTHTQNPSSGLAYCLWVSALFNSLFYTILWQKLNFLLTQRRTHDVVVFQTTALLPAQWSVFGCVEFFNQMLMGLNIRIVSSQLCSYFSQKAPLNLSFSFPGTLRHESLKGLSVT